MRPYKLRRADRSRRSRVVTVRSLDHASPSDRRRRVYRVPRCQRAGERGPRGPGARRAAAVRPSGRRPAVRPRSRFRVRPWRRPRRPYGRRGAARRRRSLPPGGDGRAWRRFRRRTAVRGLQRPGDGGPARGDGPRADQAPRAGLVHGRLRRRGLLVRRARSGGDATAAIRRRPRRRPVRAALRALRRAAVSGAGARGDAAPAAQRVRRHQGRPGAPLRLLGQGDRGSGGGAALSQRVRPRDAARYAVRRGGVVLPLFPGGRPRAAGLRGRSPAPGLHPRPRRGRSHRRRV